MMLVSEKITYRYKKNKRTILNSVDYSLEEGQFSAVMGESGSGKSTFLAIMAGILKPVEGTVKYNDVDLYELPDKELSKIHRNSICYVPQSNIMLKNITVLENIVNPYIESDPEADLKKKAISLLEKLGI